MRRISEGFRFRSLTVSVFYLSLLLLAPSLAGAVTFTNLHSFQVMSIGSQPLAPVALGSDSILYGTASRGGTNGGNGTVYKLTTNGLATLLHSFTGDADGGGPESALTLAPDTTFYGTTRGGGVYGSGTAFKITTNGILTTLVQFTGTNDGGSPVGGLVLAQDGNFYGATENGGAFGQGTVFKLAPRGKLTTLFAFHFTDGANPLAQLALGGDGKLYGTTTRGGGHNNGTVFQITTNGALVTLYSFGSVPLDAFMVKGPLVRGADGNFYGTAYGGGTNGLGCIFMVTTNGALTNLYSFGAVRDANGNPSDGSRPVGGLVFGGDGNLYGTTESGGTNDVNLGGDGTIFRMTPAGQLTNLYSFFNRQDGGLPDASLLLVGGNLYGTASQGGVAAGAAGNGTVFRIGTNGAFAFVYDFPGIDGLNPSAELAIDERGDIYGTAEYGGLFGLGTVFKYQTNGTFTILTNFDGTDGAVPDGQLLRIADGSFLGTALHGGIHNRGTVFKVTTNGSLSTFYNFGSVTNGAGLPIDGYQPWSGLTLGRDGNYYGTTYSGGGGANAGVLFGITTNGALISALPFQDTGDPEGANLLLGPDGNLYGTTSWPEGSVFAYTAGGLTNLYNFSSGSDGGRPKAGLALGPDGYFYGTTTVGGDYGYGTIFKITTNGLLTTLYSFDGTNGGWPMSTLLLARDGTFYGTTLVGGINDCGVIFQFKPGGGYAVVHWFIGLADGANPDCGLIVGLDGNLYGVAEFGGAGGNGTLFELIFSDPAPVLLSVTPTNNAVVLTWSAVIGRMYQLQSNSDLGQNVWSNVGSPVLATDAIVVAIDPAPLAARRFYRVAMLP